MIYRIFEPSLRYISSRSDDHVTMLLWNLHDADECLRARADRSALEAHMFIIIWMLSSFCSIWAHINPMGARSSTQKILTARVDLVCLQPYKVVPRKHVSVACFVPVDSFKGLLDQVELLVFCYGRNLLLKSVHISSQNDRNEQHFDNILIFKNNDNFENV